MNVNRPIILSQEIEPRFQCFVLFEPASSRLTEFDVLVRGEQVREFYEDAYNSLIESDNIKSLIVLNRIKKIGQMIDLLSSFEHVTLSKFFDRIWRRYSYVSNIGESFLDLPTFLTIFPEYGEDKMSLLAQRIDDEDEDDDVGGSDDKKDPSDSDDEDDDDDSEDDE